jgi:hypothetical protein
MTDREPDQRHCASARDPMTLRARDAATSVRAGPLLRTRRCPAVRFWAPCKATSNHELWRRLPRGKYMRKRIGGVPGSEQPVGRLPREPYTSSVSVHRAGGRGAYRPPYESDPATPHAVCSRCCDRAKSWSGGGRRHQIVLSFHICPIRSGFAPDTTSSPGKQLLSKKTPLARGQVEGRKHAPESEAARG